MQNTKPYLLGKKVMNVMLISTLVLGTFGMGTPVRAEDTNLTFKTQIGGVFDGMPLFDGVPEHLDAYVNTYFAYTGLEGPAVYASGTRNHYTLTQGANAGKKIPGALSAADNVQGISTDFPALVGMGQTWNKELLSDIGTVIGNEKISQLNVKQGTSNIHGGSAASPTVAFSVVSDMRVNPLSGRFDEGFSEDAYMAGTLIDNMAAGLGGTDQLVSDNGFWMRAAVGTKHYSVYNAQWFRFTANNSVSARSTYEYQTRSPLQALGTGSVSGVMTSFGRTNGIPNILSPLQLYANNNSKYGVYSSPDFNGDAHVFAANEQGNGYDTQYAKDRTLANVLMVLAKANAGRPSPSEANGIVDVTALVAAVQEGKYGVTAEDLIEAARPHVNQMVRVGIFNEVDDNGVPKFYPFVQDAKDVRTVTAATYNVPEHQAVALSAAQESIVLLKNDGMLPLEKDKKASISGVYADARFKTTYSVGTTPTLTNSGTSPLLAIIKAIGANNVSYDSALKVVALTSKLNGQTVTADVYAQDSTLGAQLVTLPEPVNIQDPAQLFQIYDWGQSGYSLKSMNNGRFVTSPAAANAVVGNTNNTALNLTNNDWDLAEMQGTTSAIPPTLRLENNEDNTMSMIASGYRTGFTGDFSNWYYTNGRFVRVGTDGKLVTSASTLGNAANAAIRNDDVKFEPTVVKEVGADAVARADSDDYAVVFVGAIPRHSAGEGTDRSSLNMSDADYELVDKVSAAFAAKGKKTVVIVKSSFPVGMERIQNNPNVSAILYQPYGGQYDSFALAQTLYGDYAPTGRLTSSWYADMSAFPAINKYVIPEGNTTISLADIDPRYTVDMTNADPIESELTYMYTKAPVTYPFGYGLSYSSFLYSNFTAPSSITGDDPFNVSVDVKNEGAVNTSEVVQVYINNKQSAYGSYAPQKQLASFEKVQLNAGETKTVVLTVNPKDFGIWDVNRNDFIVENGEYTLTVGSSSNHIRAEKNLAVRGTAIATLSTYQPINVFDHTFASHEVIYHEVSKLRTADNLKEKKVVGGYHAVHSKQNGSWVAIPNMDLTGVKSLTASVATDSTGGTIRLHTDSPTGTPIALINVPQTQKNTYTISSAGVEVNELGYSDVPVDLGDVSLTGNHTLYLVFEAPDLRIDSLSFQSTPNISTSGMITSGQVNPTLVIKADRAAFAEAATDVANWNFKANATGLQFSSVKLDDTGKLATLAFTGTAAVGSFSIEAKASAFAGNVTDSNLLTVTITNGSSGGSSPVINPPGTNPPVNIPPVVRPSAATVNAAGPKDISKVDKIKAPGVVQVGKPVNITLGTEDGAYALVTLNISKEENEKKITTVVRVADDGTLTPVPSIVTTDANGNFFIKALVTDSGTYVNLLVQRSFKDVAPKAWYASDIEKASRMLLINGFSENIAHPAGGTTTAQTLMVALNVLGMTPDKKAEDKTWYEGVVRTAAELDLVSYSSLASDQPMSRQNMASILVNALRYAGLDMVLTEAETTDLLKGYTDISALSETNRTDMAAAIKYGIFKGTPGSKLMPSDELTRAQMAAVALRVRAVLVNSLVK